VLQCGQAQPGGENGARVALELFVLNSASHIGTFLGALRVRHGGLVNCPRLARDAKPRVRWELTAVFHDLHEEVDVGTECGSLEPSRYSVEGEGLAALARRDEAQPRLLIS
jgi:hypothetical protein